MHRFLIEKRDVIKSNHFLYFPYVNCDNNYFFPIKLLWVIKCQVEEESQVLFCVTQTDSHFFSGQIIALSSPHLQM